MAAITLKNIVKKYGDGFPAVNDVSIDIADGEFVILVGPSGCGKTTTLRMVAGLETPTSGTITLAGQDITYAKPYRRPVNTVFQNYALFPHLDIFENVAFALEVIGKPRRFIRKVVPEVVELVGLEGKSTRMPDELSGGEQQRVAVARAFVNRPMILIADEPTGNLDPNTSVGIMKLLDRINRTGTTVVMATHDAAIVDSMRRRVVELAMGKVVRDQTRGVYGYGA